MASQRRFHVLNNSLKTCTGILCILVLSSGVRDRSDSSDLKQKIKLVGWKDEPCNNTYDPYRLVNRITAVESRNDRTFITVSFSENCCIEFTPEIQFKKNKLYLYSQRNYTGDYCGCNCCFSIQFEISGLPEKEYAIYFNGKKIERSNDHYKVFPPSQETYNGAVINRTNKYGFKEGIWKTFYGDGKIESFKQYSDNQVFYDEDPIFTREFYHSGAVKSYSRRDTSESWFEDGELKHQKIQYKHGDTSFTYILRKYDNRQLKQKSLERHYPTVHKSQFDSSYKAEGSRFDKVYEERFYKSGKPEYLFNKDTSYTWFENSIMKEKDYPPSGRIRYNERGFITEKAFHWYRPGVKIKHDLSHSLYVEFYENQSVSKVHYVRDEEVEDGFSNHHFEWEWDNQGKLTGSPDDWNDEEFPWRSFPEIKIP